MDSEENTTEHSGNMPRIHNRSGPVSNDPSISPATSTPQKEAIKAVLLDTLSKTNIRMYACKQAGIQHSTFMKWCRAGFITQEELDVCLVAYQDYLRGEIFKVGVTGVEMPMVRNGRVVYDDDGSKVMEYKKDSKVLIEIAKRYLPEYKDTNKTIVIQNDDGIHDEFRVVFDFRQVTREEADVLKTIAQNIADRQAGVIDTSIVSTNALMETAIDE